MRWLAILTLAAALGGCNLVYSERPLFTARNADAAPQAEPGLWLLENADCAVDVTTPVAPWPACAEHQLVTAEGARAYRLFHPREMLLAGGDPLIVQTREKDEHGRSAYFYAGGLATAYGPDGRATAFRFWPVQCGPPPPPPAPGEKRPRYVTEHPLRGLRINGADCLARDAGAVRGAAKASEAWIDGKPNVIRWVRAS
jgi:hypothetical protein